MKIAVLSTKNQWFEPHAKKFAKKISADFFNDYALIFNYEIVFILSYHKIISENLLKNNKLNLVVHASNLPQGKGFAPMFWQVLEGENEIVFSLFEASAKCDAGDIYLKETLSLNGLELYDELRAKQADFTIYLCEKFLKTYPNIKAKKQSKSGESFYQKRSPKDSELDIHKSIKEQFNLLRICSNDEFPAFFYKDKEKFIIKIYKENQ